MNMNEFLSDRGLEPALADKMGWHEETGKGGDVAVAIPYSRNGDILGRKFRLIGDKRFFAEKGWERDLWNVDVLHDKTLKDQPVIITEGEMDALSCIQAGFVRTVSIPDGWSENFETGNQRKSDPLFRNEAALKAARVIVAGDNDPVGMSFVRFVANMLDEQDVRWVRWPKGCKDANDTLKAHGEAGVTKAVQGAVSVAPEGGIITGLLDLPPSPPRRLFKTGIDKIDRLCVLEPGTMSVLTGIPGHGKSTWATWLAHRLSHENNIRCGLLMMETNQERIKTQLVGLEGNKSDALERLDGRFRVLQREANFDGSHNMGWLKSMIRAAAMQHECKFILVDPWNELEHDPMPGESHTNYINVALAAVRQWAERYDTHIMVSAHPKKMIGDARAPVGYDIADSAAWVNKPSIGLTVFRDESGTQLINWKVRDREFYGCHPGSMSLEFDATKLCYRPAMFR